jgi:hypothetical protein
MPGRRKRELHLAASPHQLENQEPRTRPAPRAAYSQIPRSLSKLLKRCTFTEFGIVTIILDEMYCLQGQPWVRITEAELADRCNVSVEAVHRALKKICRWAPGDLPDDDELECAENSLQLLLVRRAGRGREYKALDQNFSKAPERDPRTVTRKPPQSEGIADADQEVHGQGPVQMGAGNPHSSAGFARVGSSLPLAALRQAAPNAIFVQINGGPPIALSEACPNAQTCGLAQKFGLRDEQVSERSQISSAGIGLVGEAEGGRRSLHSSAGLLAAVNDRLRSRVGKSKGKLEANTKLWVCTLAKLGDTPHDVFLSKIDGALDRIDGYGLLEKLAAEAAAEWKPFVSLYEEFRAHYKANQSIPWAADEFGISRKRAEQWASWIEDDEYTRSTEEKP